MAIPSKIYLDTNLLYGWFQNQLNTKKSPSRIVKFLNERCKDIEKFISVYSIAELVVDLKQEFQDREISIKKIAYLFDILKDTIGLKIILEIKLTGAVIEFAELCDDHNDAIHIEAAKNENLTLITKDEDIGRVKDAYSNVISIGKLMKQFN